MKRKHLTAILVGAIALAGISGAGFAVAPTLLSVGQSWLSPGNRLEFKMNRPLPTDEAKRWQEMKQKFTDAGIYLTPQQEATIRQAQRRLIRDLRQILKDKSPAEARQAIGLNERLGNRLLIYRTRVLNSLTPEQRPVWEERVWQRLGK